MRAVLAHVSRADVGERDAVDAVLKHLSRAELASGVVTRETIENALEEMRAEGEIDRAAADGEDDEDTDRRTDVAATNDALMMQHTEGLIVCDAFKTKRYVYDPQRRMFDETAASKIERAGRARLICIAIGFYCCNSVWRDRNSLNDRRFERRIDAESSCRRFNPFGRYQRRFISKFESVEDGRFHMEDLTGTVRVDLTACERSAGLFTENCVVIAEGEVRQDGVFEVIELMFPPSEVAEATRNATNALDFSAPGTFYDRTSWRSSRGRSKNVRVRCFVLSDVWLDQQRTFDRLEKMFDVYDAQDVIPD